MRVKSLNINNLRNLDSVQFEPEDGLNCFIGENGAGKTSILESLVVLSKGRSFRTGQISSLIGPVANHFQVVAEIESQNDSSHLLGMERGTDYWTARHNKEDVTQLSELTQLVPHVLLEPSSHTLVSGPPEGRRRYLDWGVFHVEHDYLLLWRRYSRALKQRNAALRQSNLSVVESLDPQLISLGERLHQSRERHACVLNEKLAISLPIFNDTLKGITLSYRKGWAGEGLAEAIQNASQRDAERGSTGPGPHKADLYLSLNGGPAKDRLSRGEQKAMTAAMIMAQAQMICESGEKPLLLLDDAASELDELHLGRVLEAVSALGVQTWLTGTSQEEVFSVYGDSTTMFHVKQGQVTKTTE